ncbi:MAG: prolyl oligopeptidase family serine peptidase, partial [Muribaculaceae bacterium]|nr:prolyl oligopeptidase family serine peptidase [Muribaculaceae bacterium]
MKLNRIVMTCGAVALVSLTTSTMQAKINYPKAKKVAVTDDYFGTQVADPYRWLEDDNSAETKQWVDAENKITRDYLDKIPFRKDLKKRLTELANYQKMGTPFYVKDKIYYFYNDGLQNQSILYVKDKIDGEGRKVFDPNTLSTDGTVALQSLNFSKDGRYAAYTITRNGSDWNEILVHDLVADKMLDDHIVWAKFTDAQWLGDGFFYSAYDEPEDAKSSKNEWHKVMYHKLGTPQSEDYLEFRSYDDPLLFHQVGVDEDERFVFILQSAGEGNALYVKDLKGLNPHYVKIAQDGEFAFSPIGVDNGKIYVMTNQNAPCYKVLAYDANNLGEKNFTEFIPEKQWVLSGIQMTDHKFIVTYDKDASNHAYLYDANGKEMHEIKLPALGSVGFSSKNTRKEVFYNFTSYTFPSTVYSYNAATNESKVFFQPAIALNPADYQIDQVFYPSKDGTKIPMFLIYKKGLKKDGKRPVFLYGYGGFNVSMNPAFSYSRTPFAMLDEGGICAYTNLRGGGEYGEQWHEAGTKMKKQNVF